MQFSRLLRTFRVYGKKRGRRRTLPASTSSAVTAGWFALSLGVGGWAMVLLLSRMLIPEWRANHTFRQTTCEVRDRRLVASRSREEGGSVTYRPEFKIRYQVDGRNYETWTYNIQPVYTAGKARHETTLKSYGIGRRYPCWYDPAHPETAVLVRGYTWVAWGMLLIPLSFITIGGTGLGYLALNWGKSAERRAVIAARPMPLEIFDVAPAEPSEFPYVPQDSNLTNSPGTTLRFRLPADPAPSWTIFVTLAVAVIVNGLVALFIVRAVRNHLAGRPDWILAVFILPWLAVGIGAIVFLIRQVLIATGVGTTLLEISDHPLVPGGHYEVLLSQAGRLRFRALRVLLACEEQAAFQQGTNTRTDRRRVFEQELLRRESFETTSSEPLLARSSFDLNAHAMHSFKADHNEIHWALVVEGTLAGWPDFARRFPIVVHPPHEVSLPR